MVSEQTCMIDHKWTKACDKRSTRLTSYIHHTCEYKQYCNYLGNTAKQCRLGLFQDSDFPGDLEHSKSTSSGTSSVSHSPTKPDIISLDVGLTLDGIPALDLWDLIVFVIGNTIQTPKRPGRPIVNNKDPRSQRMINVLNNFDCVHSKIRFSRQEALLFVFEDNEAVIKMNSIWTQKSK